MQRPERSKKYYKAALNEDELKKNRQDVQFSVRKQKRFEQSKKRRNISSTPISSDLSHQYLQQMPQIIAAIASDQRPTQAEATRKLRILLSLEVDPPFDYVINSYGLITRIISFLDASDFPQLQLEAAWCITNIASGDKRCTELVVQEGAIPKFIQLLGTMYDDIKEQAIWGLGNIAGDCSTYRDMVLQHGALEPLCKVIEGTAKITMLRNATWALSNFCRGTPSPPTPLIKEILVWLCKLMYRDEDEEILIDALWAFSYLTEGSEDTIDEILRSGVARKITDALLHNRVAVKIPALRTVGNIVAGEETHAQLLINIGVLPCLSSLLTYYKYGICKEACWAISNITAGNTDQIDHVIHANIIPPLILLVSNAQYVIKIEAAWSIANICTGGTSHQVQYVVGQGCIKPLVDLLDMEDTSVVIFTLDALAGILKVGERVAEENMAEGKNLFADYIEQSGGLQKIEQLSVTNSGAEEKAEEVLTFFNRNKENCNNDLMTDTQDVIQNQNSFTFGTHGAPTSF